MDAATVLFDRLHNRTAAQNRVYPLLLPQSPVLPAVTHQQVSAVRLHAMGRDGNLTRVRVQVNCWAKSHADVHTLAGQVKARLSRFKGNAGGVQVADVLLDNEFDQYEPDSQTRRVIQDYTLFLVTE